MAQDSNKTKNPKPADNKTRGGKWVVRDQKSGRLIQSGEILGGAIQVSPRDPITKPPVKK